jgi:AAHS family 4-hydroxybenzoate transporter-like MFS transporter
MDQRRQFDPSTVIDDAPIGAYRYGIFAVCGLIALLDGFDTQCMAFAAPAVAAMWKVSPTQLGMAFTAALLGAIAGGLVFGFLADRRGSRRVLTWSLALMGVGSLACTRVVSIEALTAWGFVTGLGLGSVIPCLTALASAYAPTRSRATIVTSIFVGIPAGALLGGVVSSKLITLYDWQAIFLVGGIAPLLLLLVTILFLPEPLAVMSARKRPAAEIVAILRRIAGHDNIPLNAQLPLCLHRVSISGQSRLRDLFGASLRFRSICVGTMFFAAVLLGYFLLSWTPLLLRRMNFPMQHAIYGAVLLSLGSILGSIAISRLTDRFGITRVLPTAFTAGAVAVAGMGTLGTLHWIWAAAFVAGFLCLGAQLAALGVLALIYPPDLRGSSVGWANAAAKAGALLGPSGGGLLISAGLSLMALFLVAAIPALVAAAAALALGLAQDKHTKSGSR